MRHPTRATRHTLLTHLCKLASNASLALPGPRLPCLLLASRVCVSERRRGVWRAVRLPYPCVLICPPPVLRITVSKTVTKPRALLSTLAPNLSRNPPLPLPQAFFHLVKKESWHDKAQKLIKSVPKSEQKQRFKFARLKVQYQLPAKPSATELSTTVEGDEEETE